MPQLGQAWVNARTTTPSLTRNCWPQCPATWTFPVRTPLYIFLGNKGIRTPSVRPRGLAVVRAPAHVLACVLPGSPFFFLYALDAPQPPPVSLLLLLEFAHAQPAELLPPSPRRPCDVFVAAWHSLSFLPASILCIYYTSVARCVPMCGFGSNLKNAYANAASVAINGHSIDVIAPESKFQISSQLHVHRSMDKTPLFKIY